MLGQYATFRAPRLVHRLKQQADHVLWRNRVRPFRYKTTTLRDNSPDVKRVTYSRIIGQYLCPLLYTWVSHSSRCWSHRGELLHPLTAITTTRQLRRYQRVHWYVRSRLR